MRVRGFGRNLNLVLVSYFLDMLAYGGLYVLLGSLYLVRLGYDVKLIGIINAVGLLVYSVLSYPAGHLVSRWGRRKSMLIGALIAMMFMAIFILTESLPKAAQLCLFVASMVVAGTGYSLYLACVPPAVMEAEPDRRPAAFSAMSIAVVAGQSLGSLAGGLLVILFANLLHSAKDAPEPYRLALVAALLVQVGTVACIGCMRRGELEPTGSTQSVQAPARGARLSRSLFAVIVLTGLLGTLLGTAVGNYINLDLDQVFHVPTGSLGVALGLARGLPLAALILAPFCVKRLGAYATAILSLVSTSIAAASVGAASGWLMAAGGFMVMNFLSSVGSPATSLIYQEAAPERARSVVAGLQNGAGGLAMTGIWGAGGFLIAGLGYGRFFLVFVVANVLSAVIFAGYFRKPERRTATPSMEPRAAA